jgi:hypothetical protein
MSAQRVPPGRPHRPGQLDAPVTPRQFNFRYRSPSHFVEVFRSGYGPVHKAFAALPAEKAAALERDMIELFEGANRGGAGSFVAPSEYLEAVITRR